MHASATGLHGVRPSWGAVSGDAITGIVTSGVNLASVITSAVTTGKQNKFATMTALQQSQSAERIAAIQLAQSREATQQAALNAKAAAAAAAVQQPSVLPWVIGGVALLGATGLGLLLLGRKKR